MFFSWDRRKIQFPYFQAKGLKCTAIKQKQNCLKQMVIRTCASIFRWILECLDQTSARSVVSNLWCLYHNSNGRADNHPSIVAVKWQKLFYVCSVEYVVLQGVLQKSISNLNCSYSKKYETNSNKMSTVAKIFHFLLHLEVFID